MRNAHQLTRSGPAGTVTSLVCATRFAQWSRGPGCYGNGLRLPTTPPRALQVVAATWCRLRPFRRGRGDRRWQRWRPKRSGRRDSPVPRHAEGRQRRVLCAALTWPRGRTPLASCWREVGVAARLRRAAKARLAPIAARPAARRGVPRARAHCGGVCWRWSTMVNRGAFLAAGRTSRRSGGPRCARRAAARPPKAPPEPRRGGHFRCLERLFVDAAQVSGEIWRELGADLGVRLKAG
jgi:hypothetical protein